jgi:SSS family solute:Na+ symporter
LYFQYYSMVITVVCILVMIIVSYATQAPDYAKISGLTFGTVTDEHRQQSRASWSKGDVVTSVIVVILIFLCYLYFTG